MSRTKTIKETKSCHSVSHAMFFCNRFFHSWIVNTCSALLVWHFPFNLWILCSKSIHKWNHVCRLVKTLLMHCHTQSSLHAEIPFHFYSCCHQQKIYIYICFWLSDMKYKFTPLCVFCNNNLGKDNNDTTDANEKKRQSNLLALLNLELQLQKLI